jgi:hypothetical protein
MLSIHLGVMTLSAFPMESLALCDENMQVKAMARFTSDPQASQGTLRRKVSAISA